jgi:ribonuclease HII
MKQLRTRVQKFNKDIHQFVDSNIYTIIGVDEVGRGCIAGPVCAGVVVFNADATVDLSRYIDSKKINEKNRNSLAQEITENHFSALGWSSVEEVDELNIRQASLLAMKRAVLKIKDLLASHSQFKLNNHQKKIVLIDGNDTLPDFNLFEQQSVIKGDQKIRQISAASIIAKVARDNYMKAQAVQYTHYGFEKHKGYGTEEHRIAIQKNGICELHRKSFGGVKEFLL